MPVFIHAKNEMSSQQYFALKMYTFFVFVKPPFSPFEEMIDGEAVQIGRGQDERPFNIESVTQVNIKKFRTTGMNYRVRFTDALADVKV